MPKEKSKRKSILWVEDDKLLIKLYKGVLSATGDFDVEFIELGKLAIDRVREIEAGTVGKPDLIMLDLLLPDINGDKILEEIKKTPAMKGVPVYILTNYGGEEMETRLTQNLDAERYLVKIDWGPNKLIPLIKNRLE